MNGKFANTGILTNNERRSSDKAPVMTGVINISDEMVADLQSLIEMGEEARIRVAAWRGKAGGYQLKLEIMAPQQEQQGYQKQSAPPQRPRFAQAQAAPQQERTYGAPQQQRRAPSQGAKRAGFGQYRDQQPDVDPNAWNNGDDEIPF